MEATAANAAPEVKKGQHNPFAHALLEQAQELQTERKDYLKRVDSNRSLLRSIKTTGLLSKDQAKAIEAFYPAPKRGEKDDAATTTAAS